jgi:hypothetical protein
MAPRPTPSLANISLRDRYKLSPAIMENAARCRALPRPLCRNGIERIKVLMLSMEICHEDVPSRTENLIQALELRSQRPLVRATVCADTPIRNDDAFDKI